MDSFGPSERNNIIEINLNFISGVLLANSPQSESNWSRGAAWGIKTSREDFYPPCRNSWFISIGSITVFLLPCLQPAFHKTTISSRASQIQLRISATSSYWSRVNDPASPHIAVFQHLADQKLQRLPVFDLSTATTVQIQHTPSSCQHRHSLATFELFVPHGFGRK